jgi:hypothetical protein
MNRALVEISDRARHSSNSFEDGFLVPGCLHVLGSRKLRHHLHKSDILSLIEARGSGVRTPCCVVASRILWSGSMAKMKSIGPPCLTPRIWLKASPWCPFIITLRWRGDQDGYPFSPTWPEARLQDIKEVAPIKDVEGLLNVQFEENARCLVQVCNHVLNI